MPAPARKKPSPIEHSICVIAITQQRAPRQAHACSMAKSGVVRCGWKADVQSGFAGRKEVRFPGSHLSVQPGSTVQDRHHREVRHC
jgi:hypothetical protein